MQSRTYATILEVLEEWGCGWLWDGLHLTGDPAWLVEVIRDESLIAVTDAGLFIKELILIPDVCSACFVLECTRGRGRIIVIGSFAEHMPSANAYQGEELLELLAVHLLLCGVQRLETGTAHIM